MLVAATTLSNAGKANNYTTNEKITSELNSIERELKRQRNESSQKRGLQSNDSNLHQRFNSIHKAPQVIQSSQFNIVHERNKNHYSSMADMPLTETMNYEQSRGEGSDLELTLQQATAFQHLNLAQMTMTKPGIVNSNRTHGESSEELTQMSCGRNMKEYFQASNTSYNLHTTSRSGLVNSA